LFVLRRMFLIASLFFTSLSWSQELKVAAASDLTGVMEKLASAFEKNTSVHVSVSLGASGNFFTQIQSGAPFDVFLSADRSYAEKLTREGKAEAKTVTYYARGRLVLWVSNDSPLQVQLRSKDGVLTGDLKGLASPGVKKIAIANPDVTPYGRAAVSVLQRYKVYDQVKPKLVLSENISQTAQLAQLGNADVAFISYSLALSSAMARNGICLLLPDDSYAPIEQTGAVVSASQNKAQGGRFLQFLTSPEAQAILHEFGYENPTK
jgi:molybdate transport system substrate-binding protein